MVSLRGLGLCYKSSCSFIVMSRVLSPGHRGQYTCHTPGIIHYSRDEHPRVS